MIGSFAGAAPSQRVPEGHVVSMNLRSVWGRRNSCPRGKAINRLDCETHPSNRDASRS